MPPSPVAPNAARRRRSQRDAHRSRRRPPRPSREPGKALHAPATAVAGRALDAEDPGRLTRRERNIEAIERMAKAVSERLDECFLARPAIEESQRLVARVEGQVSLVLAAGKKACRDVIGVADHAHHLDVDSDLATARKGVHGELVGVRYVESQVRVREMRRERRFAVASRRPARLNQAAHPTVPRAADAVANARR